MKLPNRCVITAIAILEPTRQRKKPHKNAATQVRLISQASATSASSSERCDKSKASTFTALLRLSYPDLPLLSVAFLFLVLYAVVAVIIAKLIMETVNRYCTKRFDLNEGESFTTLIILVLVRFNDNAMPILAKPTRSTLCSCTPDGKVDREDCVVCLDSICPGFKD